MFTPFEARGLTLKNRVLVSPMATYRAIDGMPNDFHLVHFGARAMGGAAMVFTEMTCVSPDARITPGCLGLWNDEQATAWQRIVDYVHTQTDAKIALQLGHSGRKGSTRRGWEGIDQPLPAGQLAADLGVAASPTIDGSVTDAARGATSDDLDQRSSTDFVSPHCAARPAAWRASTWLELHCCARLPAVELHLAAHQSAHKWNSGGSLEEPLPVYPLALMVFRAMREVWPDDQADQRAHLGQRLGAGRHYPERRGRRGPALQSGRRRRDRLLVGPGQQGRTQPRLRPYVPGVPLSDRIRNEVGVSTIAVGNIFEGDHVNTIIAAGRAADLCAVARPHLADPAWTLHEAAKQGYADVWWPLPYLAGKLQLERNAGAGSAVGAPGVTAPAAEPFGRGQASDRQARHALVTGAAGPRHRRCRHSRAGGTWGARARSSAAIARALR